MVSVHQVTSVRLWPPGLGMALPGPGEPVDLRCDFLKYCCITAPFDACWRPWPGQEDPVFSVLTIVFKKGFWVSSNALAASLGKILCFFHLKLSMQWIILMSLNVESYLKITSSYNDLNNFFRCPFWYQLFLELLNCFCPLARVVPTGLSGDPLGNMSGPGTGGKSTQTWMLLLPPLFISRPYLTSFVNSRLLVSRFSEFGEVTHMSPWIFCVFSFSSCQKLPILSRFWLFLLKN